VTEAIEYEQFDQTGGHAGGQAGASGADLSRLSDIPMELSVEIGRTHMTVGETLDLRVGSVVTLERLAGHTADLLVNGTAIARGEVVVIDEQYGLRITEILDSQQDSDAPAGASQPAREADGDSDAHDGQADEQPVAVAGAPESGSGAEEPAAAAAEEG
jgi:flagellar motor switch protein FliN/FliY